MTLLIHAQIAEAQKKLDVARRELRSIIEETNVADELIIEVRENARQALIKLSALDAIMLGKS